MSMSESRNNNLSAIGTGLCSSFGCRITGVVCFGSIGYGTAVILTYVPVIGFVIYKQAGEVMRVCSLELVSARAYYSCSTVVIVCYVIVSYLGVGCGTTVVLTYVPVVSSIGYPCAGEVVTKLKCGSLADNLAARLTDYLGVTVLGTGRSLGLGLGFGVLAGRLGNNGNKRKVIYLSLLVECKVVISALHVK